MRTLTAREREVLQLGPDYAQLGHGTEHWFDGKTYLTSHYKFREWIGDDARTVTERFDEVEHPFGEACDVCREEGA